MTKSKEINKHHLKAQPEKNSSPSTWMVDFLRRHLYHREKKIRDIN